MRGSNIVMVPGLVGALAQVACGCAEDVSVPDGDWVVTSVSDGMPAGSVGEVGTLSDGTFRLEYTEGGEDWAAVLAFQGSTFMVEAGRRGCVSEDGVVDLSRVEALSGGADLAAATAQWEQLTILRPNVITAEWGNATELTLRGNNEVVALDVQ